MDQTRAPGKLLRVLVVDDHERLRAVLSSTLAARVPAEVVQAGDIDEALTHAHEAPFDALVVDVNLPRTSGLDALPRLRAACPHGRIVLMSAAVAPGLEEKALRAGADQFIAKSAGLQELCRAVDPGWNPPAAG